jgi:hypothetical protein
MKTSFTPGRRWSAIPLTNVAPASSASETISSTSSGESLMPGINGATSTPDGMPASLNFATASSRLRGWGVCGSVSRQIFSSRVGTEKLTLTSATAASSTRASKSRPTSDDLVRIEVGVSASFSASIIGGISSYFPSAHWYGSVFVPNATNSRFQLGRLSSAQSSSGTFTLTTISRSKSRPAFRSR